MPGVMSGPPSGGSSQLPDLIAFLAVVISGTLLVIFGHLTPGAIAAYAAGLAALFTAWRHRGPMR